MPETGISNRESGSTYHAPGNSLTTVYTEQNTQEGFRSKVHVAGCFVTPLRCASLDPLLEGSSPLGDRVASTYSLIFTLHLPIPC
jgi:hypothetical protein